MFKVHRNGRVLLEVILESIDKIPFGYSLAKDDEVGFGTLSLGRHVGFEKNGITLRRLWFLYTD